MNLSENQRINLEYYNAKITEYGQDVHTLWNSLQSQQVRFKILSEIGDFNNRSMLDVGCGFGDLYLFLKEQNVHLKKYVGIDMNPQMIAMASSRLPEAAFEVKNILDNELNEKYDYVVASGIFSLEMPDWQAVAEKIISKMYQLSEIAVGANFLSFLTTGEKLPHAHYAHPAEMINFVAKNLSTRIVLRHDYRPNDFTIYIYKPFA